MGSLTGSSASDYGFSNADKIPRYTAGSTVRVVWPAKNHANYECFNFIPDNSMKLFINPNVNPTADLPNTGDSMLAQGYELVKDWHDDCTPGEDGCGFQNCPKFCENTDKATCFGDFVVPTVDTSGYYTFVWYWIFNPGSPYITCWEAYIESDGSDDGSTPSPVEPSAGTPSPTTPAPVTPAPTTGTNPQGSITGYLTQIPVCITGDDYVADTLSDFVEDEFADVDSVTATYILRVDETDDGYDFLAQVSHSAAAAEVTDIATVDLCSDFESTFGITVSCDVSDDCGEVVTFATYDNSGGDTDTDTDGNTPSPVTVPVSGDAIVVSNDQATQAYYLSFVMDHIDNCYSNIDAVQLDMGSGNYVNNDQYYYDNGHKFAFNYVDTQFSDLLPISLRILFKDNSYVDLENIIADLGGNSVFQSAKTCDNGNVTPAPTTNVVVQETVDLGEETTAADMDTTVLYQLSSAMRFGIHGTVYTVLVLLVGFCL